MRATTINLPAEERRILEPWGANVKTDQCLSLRARIFWGEGQLTAQISWALAVHPVTLSR